MEALLEALKSPRALLPCTVIPLLDRGQVDVCLDLAAAHLLLRSGDDQGLLDAVMSRLGPLAASQPDAAILEREWHRRRGRHAEPLLLRDPPMLRASFLMALTGTAPTQIPPCSAIAQSSRSGYHDSVWWTWSHRPWDARWIEPTVEGLLARGGVRDLASIARTIAIPTSTLEQTVAQIDATIPQLDDGTPTDANVDIHGYRIAETLGRGSQGAVYRAFRELDGRAIALKVLAFSGGGRRRAQALWEIRAMRRYPHPRLLALMESGELSSGGGVWLELELCRGSVMDRLIELDSPMPIEEAGRIALEALEGLVHLHNHNVVHRDVKPANLLIRFDGSVAVADFGLVRISAPTKNPSPARAGGTARFAPPEQLLDVHTAGPRSDVWSLAATLYFLLTLELPRDEYADQTELEAARDNVVVPIRDRRPDLPLALATAIDAALSTEIWRRPDAMQFHQRLIQALGGQPGRRRAFVIGAQSAGLKGADNDAHAMAALLTSRGFEVELRTAGVATHAGLHEGFERFVASTQRGDSLVVYYSGQAFAFSPIAGPVEISEDGTEVSVLERRAIPRTLSAADGPPVMSITPSDFPAAPIAVLPLWRLLAQTPNLVTIVDSCLIDGGALHVAAPFVQLTACGEDGVAFEYMAARETFRGVFTSALIETLDEIGDLPVSWNAIVRAARVQVLERFPTQTPQVAGPATHRPFSLLDSGDHGVYEVTVSGSDYLVVGGRLTGTVVGDRFAAMPAGSFTYNRDASMGELEVLEVLPAFSRSRFLGSGAAITGELVAIPIVKHGLQRAVAIEVPLHDLVQVEALVAASPALRVARPHERPLLTLRSHGGRLLIEDSVGVLFDLEGGMWSIPIAVRHMATFAAARGLRDLEGEYGVSLDEVDISLGTVIDGQRRPLPARRSALALSDRLYVRVENRSQRVLYAHLFNIGLQGRIARVERSHTGIKLHPGADHHEPDDPDQAFTISWPAALPTTTPRFEELVAIVTDRPLYLGGLENDSSRGRSRSTSNDGLQDLLDQLHDGEARRVGDRDDTAAFFVSRLPFLVAPLEGAMSGLTFELDETPAARLGKRLMSATDRFLPASETSKIAIRIRSLDVDVGSALAGTKLRIDAVICTHSSRGEPVAWTSRLAGSALPPASIFSGTVRDFVHVAIFVSSDSGPDLAELMTLHREEPAYRDAVAVLTTEEPGPQSLAFSAGAVLTRLAHDALRGMTSTTRCLYRASFLESDGYGSQVPGVYRTEDLALSIEIELVE
ncbi:MAG: protein kinase [Kofleriaceae bacterium]